MQYEGLRIGPETSVSNYHMPEDGRIQFNRGGSLESHIKQFCYKDVTKIFYDQEI